MGASAIITGLSSGDRADPRRSRRRPGHDAARSATCRAASRRPSAWLGYRGPPRPTAARDAGAVGPADVRRDPAPGRLPDRLDPVGPDRQRGRRAARRARSSASADDRARGIIVDVAALDVIDSFVARSLRAIALTARLRGAETVIVGIQPDVAIAMVQFRLEPRAAARGARPRRGARRCSSARTEGPARMADEVRVPIDADADLVPARAEGRALAERLGFSRTDRDADRHRDLRGGAQHRRPRRPRRDRDARSRGADRYGLVVVARDDGPGIRDVDAALARRLTPHGAASAWASRGAPAHGRVPGRLRCRPAARRSR